MYVGLQAKFVIFSPILARFELALQTHIKRHEKPSSGSGVVPRGRTGGRNKTNGRFWHFNVTVAGLWGEFPSQDLLRATYSIH